MVNFGVVRRAELAKSTLFTSTVVPRDLFIFLMSVHMLMRECDAESSEKLPHLFIRSKTATFVPEFAVEGLPLGRTAALVPDFAVKELPLGRRL